MGFQMLVQNPKFDAKCKFYILVQVLIFEPKFKL